MNNTDKILARIDIKHTFNQSIIKYGEEAQCGQAIDWRVEND